jgi:hypothetical protein
VFSGLVCCKKVKVFRPRGIVIDVSFSLRVGHLGRVLVGIFLVGFAAVSIAVARTTYRGSVLQCLARCGKARLSIGPRLARCGGASLCAVSRPWLFVGVRVHVGDQEIEPVERAVASDVVPDDAPCILHKPFQVAPLEAAAATPVLSGNGTPLWHATKPEAKNHHWWIAKGWSWDPYRGQRKPPSHS